MMNGFDYLSTAVGRRLQEIAAQAGEAREAGLTSTSVPTLTMLSTGVVGTIVLNIGHGLAETQGKAFDVPPFLRFEAGAKGVTVAGHATVRHALRTTSWYDDPQLSHLRPTAYWPKRLDVDTIDNAAVANIVSEFLDARLHGDTVKVLTYEQEHVAAVCVRAFFAVVVNGLVAKKAIRIDGLGRLSRGETDDDISFVADRRILMAVDFSGLREIPFPALKATRVVEIGPLADERSMTPEDALAHAEKSLPASVWDWSRDLFRLALRRKAS